MLVAAIAILTTFQRGALPYRSVITNAEAISPKPPHVEILETKRKAFDFLRLLRNDAPKPESIKKVNWRKSNVLVIYPGLFQRDARVKIKSVTKSGHTIRVTVDSHRGMTSETHYPVIVLTIDKQPKGTQTAFVDLGKLSSRVKRNSYRS